MRPRYQRPRNQARMVRNRALIRALKDSPCTDCGGLYPYYQMDFDHRDPSQKRCDVHLLRSGSLKQIKEEVAKCDIVCKMCHAEREFQRRLTKGTPQ